MGRGRARRVRPLLRAPGTVRTPAPSRRLVPARSGPGGHDPLEVVSSHDAPLVRSADMSDRAILSWAGAEVARVCADRGIARVPRVRVRAATDFDVLAVYDAERNEVLVARAAFRAALWTKRIRLMAHEVFHAYQYECIDRLVAGAPRPDDPPVAVVREWERILLDWGPDFEREAVEEALPAERERARAEGSDDQDEELRAQIRLRLLDESSLERSAHEFAADWLRRRGTRASEPQAVLVRTDDLIAGRVTVSVEDRERVWDWGREFPYRTFVVYAAGPGGDLIMRGVGSRPSHCLRPLRPVEPCTICGRASCTHLTVVAALAATPAGDGRSVLDHLMHGPVLRCSSGPGAVLRCVGDRIISYAVRMSSPGRRDDPGARVTRLYCKVDPREHAADQCAGDSCITVVLGAELDAALPDGLVDDHLVEVDCTAFATKPHPLGTERTWVAEVGDLTITMPLFIWPPGTRSGDSGIIGGVTLYVSPRRSDPSASDGTVVACVLTNGPFIVPPCDRCGERYCGPSVLRYLRAGVYRTLSPAELDARAIDQRAASEVWERGREERERRR